MTCRVLKLARQPYYRWLANPVTGAQLDQAYRANALFDAYRDDPEFATGSLSRKPAPPVHNGRSHRMADRTAWPIAPHGRSHRMADLQREWLAGLVIPDLGCSRVSPGTLNRAAG